MYYTYSISIYTKKNQSQQSQCRQYSNSHTIDAIGSAFDEVAWKPMVAPEELGQY